MRNPALQLVGIAASPGAGGVFGSRAEEELRHWLEQRLDALGIDPVAYSRFVLSLLRHPDSALSPPLELPASFHGRNNLPSSATTAAAAAVAGRRSKARFRSKLPTQQPHREQRRAVVQCLTSAADQSCGVETLVDELCAKLRDLEGADSKDEQEESKTASDSEPQVPFETLTPRDRALRYYAAFPALQPTTTSTTSPKKPPQRKERNPTNSISIYNSKSNSSINNNNNNNYYNNNNNSLNNNNSNNNKKNSSGSGNNKNNKTRMRKNKITIATESQLNEEKEDFGFVKSMEFEREKEQEQALDQLRLAQLKAKFDESLEALWDTGPGISQGTDSIWAAPSLSIPSGPSWPSDNASNVSAFPVVKMDDSTDRNSQQSRAEDSPLIPWDIDLFSIEDCADEEFVGKDKPQSGAGGLSWSDSARDGLWRWGGLGHAATLASGSSSPLGSSFFSAVATKQQQQPPLQHESPVVVDEEPGTRQKLPEVPEPPDEDLLTSARTHFRPIKEDGHWADGTTFHVNNTLERVAYRRSESRNLLYLPGGESPYMEYRENPEKPLAVSANLTLKFRVRQCDKSIQTEPVVRSPAKRRILSEQDDFYYASDAAEEVSAMNDIEDIEKDSFDLEQVAWNQSMMLLRNERKRRHSSSLKLQPLAVLRPLTL